MTKVMQRAAIVLGLALAATFGFQLAPIGKSNPLGIDSAQAQSSCPPGQCFKWGKGGGFPRCRKC